MANLLNLNAAYIQIFTNVPMIAYITDLKKGENLLTLSVSLNILSKVAKLNSVYIFTL